jgi:4-alpha-glucanotransferase
VAGLWTGADLQEQRDFDLAPNEEATNRIRAQVAESTGLDASSSLEEVVRRVHGRLADAPSQLLCATLEDLAVSERRPNMPGADPQRNNWSIPLPGKVEDLMTAPLAQELAAIFNGATQRPKASK